jgi:citrate synthase
MPAVKWLTAEQALKFLGIRAQTLYANVSRGRIRAKADPGDTRRSLYSASDVARLAGRRAGRRPAETVATQAMGWGDPVLASGVATVADGRLWYRGRDAVALAETATLEEVAALLWQMDSPRADFAASAAASPAGATPFHRLLAALSKRVALDPPTRGRSPANLRAEAQALVGTLIAAALGETPARSGLPVHRRIATAWRRQKAADVLRRALVLLADHELNASTFAVRVAASTGASLSACILAGVATLTGPLHGGAARALHSLVIDAGRIGPHAAVAEWLGRGELLPAFGHPLYADGDPRAIALMQRFEPSGVFAAIAAAGEDLVGEPPNVDFALAAMMDALQLPEHAPFVIFAVSRSVGWIAHAMEQAATDQLIRPRARYTGPALIKEAP